MYVEIIFTQKNIVLLQLELSLFFVSDRKLCIILIEFIAQI